MNKVLDYYAKNALRRYPFVDNADLSYSVGSLANDVFVDAKFFAAGNYEIRIVSLAVGSGELTIGLEYLDEEDVSHSYPDIVLSVGSITSGYKIDFSVTGLTGFFVFGDGLANVVDGDYEFASGNNFFVASAVPPAAPLVSSIVFNDLSQDGTQTEVVTASGYLTVHEGTNASFSLGQTTTIQVLAGAGTGLYNDCVLADGVRTIAGQGTSDGNFILSADGCYQLTKTEANAISITNVCSSSCSTDNINNFAYYLNRVNDGVSSLGTLLSSMRDDMASVVDDYNSVTIPVRTSPYVIKSVVKYGSTSLSTSEKNYYTYFTMRVYAFNPGTTDFLFTSGASAPSPAEIVSYKLLDRTNTVVFVGSYTIPCKEFVIAEFVARIKNPTSGSATATLTVTNNISTQTYSAVAP